MLTYLLAVLAAGANATSSVLQRMANRRVSANQNLSWRLIWSDMHQPVWFGGVLAICAGFVLQAAALHSGQLSVVEPVLILELPLTLILASRVFRQRLGMREWWPTAGITAGLAGLLYCLSPSGGSPGGVRWYAWLAGIGANLILVAMLVAWARRGQGSPRAAGLAVAAGSSFGMTAALIKAATASISLGIPAVLTEWQLYAMIAAGLLGMFLTQSAMNAGRLVAAQPGLTLSDPVVSVLWGVLAFGESVRGGWFGVMAGACAVVTAAAVIALARSPLLSGSGQASSAACQAGLEHAGGR